MIPLAITLFNILVGLALAQVACAAFFVRLFWRRPAIPVPDTQLPRVAVLLSLRGADPHLAGGLRRLLTQNYPRYEVRIVVDHDGDPAWQVVQNAIRDTGATHVHVSPLRQRSETCSLKNSALVQMAAELDDAIEVVAQADADLVSHDNWLRELVSPLVEEGVGATFGNRWFMPREGRWGSLVRYVWNVFAVVPMYLLGIPWGGTFAMKTTVLRRSDLVGRWSKSVVEDAPVRSALEELGLSVKFVPSLMMVNREECSLPFSLDFIKRQLTWTRIYHPNWLPVLLHGLGTAGALIISLVLAVWGLASGAWPLAAWAGGGLLAYLTIMLFLVGWLEVTVRRSVRGHGDRTDWMSFATLAKLVLALPLTQMVHLIAVLLAQFRRYVAWRGVTYHVRGPWEIRMVGYVPFEQPSQPAGSNTSL